MVRQMIRHPMNNEQLRMYCRGRYDYICTMHEVLPGTARAGI